MAYATVSDVEVRLQRTLSEQEQACAEMLIDAASAILNRMAEVDATDTEQAELLAYVCTSMVARAMPANMDLYGASQYSTIAGPYSQQTTWTAPVGDLYLSKLEKRMLGITQGYIGSVPVGITGYYGSSYD